MTNEELKMHLLLLKENARGIEDTIIQNVKKESFLWIIEELIKALEQQPSDDCISREEVQDLISRWLSDYLLDETREALETINYKVGDMPAVYPERPKGKWIECRSRFGVGYFKCSECGRKLDWIDRDDNYCCNCGSDNSESTEKLVKAWNTKFAEMSGGGENV